MKYLWLVESGLEHGHLVGFGLLLLEVVDLGLQLLGGQFQVFGPLLLAAQLGAQVGALCVEPAPRTIRGTRFRYWIVLRTQSRSQERLASLGKRVPWKEGVPNRSEIVRRVDQIHLESYSLFSII